MLAWPAASEGQPPGEAGRRDSAPLAAWGSVLATSSWACVLTHPVVEGGVGGVRGGRGGVRVGSGRPAVGSAPDLVVWSSPAVQWMALRGAEGQGVGARLGAVGTGHSLLGGGEHYHLRLGCSRLRGGAGGHTPLLHQLQARGRAHSATTTTCHMQVT